ncbi:hypothetical protein RYZ67_27140 [Citrobacter freundii]|uniref:Serine/threonine protein kinase n=1 Tax=Citrobacter freundii TaxID=546 RepID=A0AAP5Y0J2_CITFR|nr:MULTISPECIES: hypothetical protein [Enterobacteriaceae]MDW2762109.1 hypothetical protein [Citrobacter freundii]
MDKLRGRVSLSHWGMSWHYPISPKNRKTALRPRHDWL